MGISGGLSWKGELSRPRKVERSRDFYAPLLPNPLGRQLFESVEGTRLGYPMFGLVHTWRCISDALFLPSHVAESAPAALAGFTEKHGSRALELMRELLKTMANELATEQGMVLSAPQRRLIQAWAKRKLRRLNDVLANRQLPTVDDSWASYIDLVPFQSALVGLATYAYTAAYFAYECYLASIIEVVAEEWPSTTRKLGERIQETWGKTDADDLWDAPVVRAARIVRDAVVHRGGFLKPGTESSVTDFMDVEDGLALVTARNAAALMPELVRRVLSATTAIKTLRPDRVLGASSES